MASEKDFLFGTRKPIFSGMHRLCLLSETSWETVTFAFIYFFMLSIIFYLIPTNKKKNE